MSSALPTSGHLARAPRSAIVRPATAIQRISCLVARASSSAVAPADSAADSAGHAVYSADVAFDLPGGQTREAYKKDLHERERKYVLQTYAKPADLVITHGRGSVIYDVTGKEYLDFAAGIAVNALGHSNQAWCDAVINQTGLLAHTSNLFHSVPQVDLAERLVENSGLDRVFFCNSGTEANEAAIKFSRKWARVQAGVDPQDASAVAPHEIVCFTGAFHGRTMGALALTAKTQYQNPFLPIMGGVKQAKFRDLASAKECIVKGKTCAVFVEPVQGEGGVTVADFEFLTGLKAICEDAGCLLVFDEVQCGVGRTGKMWAHEHAGVTPDLMSIAKPLAGGLPIGAVLMKEHVAEVMKPGDHGSTFAGGPLVCAAAVATFDIINEPSFLSEVVRKGDLLKTSLEEAVGSSPHVTVVRGLGLLIGIQMDMPAGAIVDAAREAGVIVITAGAGDVIRLAPPLTCTDAEIKTVVGVLAKLIADLP